jgi:F-type H+-transporting ATPase subunit a
MNLFWPRLLIIGFFVIVLGVLLVGDPGVPPPQAGGQGEHAKDAADVKPGADEKHGDEKPGGDVEHDEKHGADEKHGDANAIHREPVLELPEFLPNILTIPSFLNHGVPMWDWIHVYMWENIFFALLTAGLIVFLVRWMKPSDDVAHVPDRKQTFLEEVIERLNGLATSVIGPEGRKYTAFIGSLFIYIWCMNMIGMVPGMKAATSYLGITGGLAIVTFFYVQYVGLRENGIQGYLHHLAGSPTDLVGWAMSPLMFVLHVVGEFIKPVSLALRLFGNVMGEDALIGVFGLLGIVVLSMITGGPTTLESMMGLKAMTTAEMAPWQWFGIPLQLPIMLLALLTGTIQALVFSLLATIYIFLMLPHDHHDEEQGLEAHH